MISFNPLSTSLKSHLLCLQVLCLQVLCLLASGPAHAETNLYLIYPESWCQFGQGSPLQFTLPQLGVEQVDAVDGPSHGRIFLSPDPEQGGYYLPSCSGLTTLGFDFFQVTGSEGELIHGTVLLDNGLPEEVEVEEKATGGTLGQGWSMESPSAGLKIVEWSRNVGLEGSHGFRVVAGQVQDSYLRFAFLGGLSSLQPPDTEGGGNNGVETEITLRPPTLPPPGPGYEQASQSSVIYASGRFNGVTAPETLLRMEASGDQWLIRAEATAIDSISSLGRVGEVTVATQWCPLTSGQANKIRLRRFHGLDGHTDLLWLSVTSPGGGCSEAEEGFVSARSQGPEHRFGSMDAQGGPTFDFDEVGVETLRFRPLLSPELSDSFETGHTWSPAWQAVGPERLSVETGAAHTGSFGLRAQPEPGSPAYLSRSISQPTADLACRFSLGANFTAGYDMPKVRIFTAWSSQGREIKLWARHSMKGYQIRAVSGSHASPWVPLRSLPATIDFRWSSGVMDVRLRDCQFDGSNCERGLQVGAASPYLITDFQLGAETTTQPVSGAVTFDNVQCLIPKTELPNS